MTINFLPLNELDVDSYQWIVFTGVSGAGKSTSIDWLIRRHPEKRFQIIDEIRTSAELIDQLNKFDRGTTHLVASHIHPAFHKLVALPYRIRQTIFNLDQDYQQLERWLETKDITFSEPALHQFKAQYGTSFTDLDTVVNSFPEPDFDLAWHLFQKLRRIKRTPE